MSENGKTPSKKAYETPRLRVYGDIAQLTRAVGTASKVPDHAGGKVNKTA